MSVSNRPKGESRPIDRSKLPTVRWVLENPPKLPPFRPDTRNAGILIRVSPAERETLNAEAKRRGLGLGPWLRSLGIAEVERVGSILALRCPECDHLTGTGTKGHKRGCSRA